jgi:hypothetical protein
MHRADGGTVIAGLVSLDSLGGCCKGRLLTRLLRKTTTFLRNMTLTQKVMSTNMNIILQVVVVRQANGMRRRPGLSVEEFTGSCLTRRDSPPYEQLDVHSQRAHPTMARLGVSFRVIVNLKSKCAFTEQAPNADVMGLSGADK